MDNTMDRSDIQSILESIDSMFGLCQQVLNSYTQTALLLSITSEAEMLLLKLRVMEQRWGIHLPFKEASKVDFYGWSKRVEQMAQVVGGADVAGESEISLDENCPSKHYLLDLYECLDESPSHTPGGASYYADPNVQKFIAEQTRIRKQIVRKWKNYRNQFNELVPRELNEHLGEVIKPLSEQGVNIRMTCHTVLRELSDALYRLYNTPRGNISRDQFARLAERVMEEDEYEGRRARRTVEHDVNDIKNNTPEDEWEARRDEEIKVAIDLIKDIRLGSKVFSFLGRDKTMFDNPAGLGRFLWSVRNDISNYDLYNLLELLYRIAYLSRDREQQAAAAKEEAAKLLQSDSKDAESVRKRRAATPLCKPRLPNFYNEKLAGNELAVESYYETLHHCGYYIGRVLLPDEKSDPDQRCYDGWKWKHLRDAFVKLGFFKADSNKKAFAEHLAEVFPYLEATNIQRGFNSRGGYTDPNAVHRIITDMIAEFEEVKELMG